MYICCCGSNGFRYLVVGAFWGGFVDSSNLDYNNKIQSINVYCIILIQLKSSQYDISWTITILIILHTILN